MKKKKNQFSDYEKIEIEKEKTLSEEVAEIDNKKKLSTTKKIIVRILMTVFVLLLGLAVFSIVSYCYIDKDLQQDTLKKYKENKYNIYTLDSTHDAVINKMCTFIDTLPETLKNTYLRDWSIILDKDVPEKLFQITSLTINNYDKSGLMIGGYTFPQQRIIYVNSGFDNEIVYTSFIHEIGHCLSFELGSEHGSERWEELYGTYKDTFNTEAYNKSDEAEFFASCFEEYSDNTEHLKKESVEIYEYFNEIIARPINNENPFKRFLAGFNNSVNTLRVYFYHYIVKR